MKKQILVVSSAFFISGAEVSLYEFLENCGASYEIILVVPENFVVLPALKHVTAYHLPFKWIHHTLGPVRLYQFILSIITCTFYLIKIVNGHNVDFIYANTAKANLYAVITGFFTKKKIVWHVRDNIKPTVLYKVLIRNSTEIITISRSIDDQIVSGKQKKHLIYGGVDIKKWRPKINPDETLINELGVPKDTRLIAQIGQLTRWKNHFDLIRAADLILQSEPEVHFLIIGDDLSGREKKYKAELKKMVAELRLEPHLSFPGNRHNIKELLNQIDIIIHPAINEPFGRVILEAMALEKPVVAYDCGGPREIIINNETGYLVEPYDYHALANKTLALIRDRELRGRFGKAGRKRVIEKFNMERYVREMEEVFG